MVFHPRFAILVLGAALVGCGGGLPAPETAAQPSDGYVPVPYPPPPARPEHIPERPAPEALWIDGEWRWIGGRWSWIYGRWVRPRAGARYALWSAQRRDDGQLEYAEGRWLSEDGRPLPPATRYDAAEAEGGDRVEDVGVMVDVGPNRKAGDEVNDARGDGDRCDMGCRLEPLPP